MPTSTLAQSSDTLVPEFIMGFSGQIHNGYCCHPDGQHALYPLGSEIVVKNIKSDSKPQSLLMGHTRPISCLAVSPTGKYVASGDETTGNFKAELILWDFEARQPLHRFSLHKAKVESIAFSPDERFMVSLGGQDDNGLILWDLHKGSAISGAVASRGSSGRTICLAYCRKSPYRFVTAGDHVHRIWDIDQETLKMTPLDCQLGSFKRVSLCTAVDFHDEFMYCGTATGDVMQISLKTGLFVQSGPQKAKDFLHGGVATVRPFASHGLVYAGSGSGSVVTMDCKSLSVVRQSELHAPITSLVFLEKEVLVGTAKSDIYRLNGSTLDGALMASNHYSPVTAVAFPDATSEIFVTASEADIRVWNLNLKKELLRIEEPGLSCHSIVLRKDGSSLITGWNDGKIRAYGPQSGKLQYTISDAHKDGVTALAVGNHTHHSSFTLISGGGNGEVRVWDISADKQKMIQAMKEHKGAVSEIRIRQNDKECVSSSIDGSCIMWNVSKGTRIQVMYATASFKSVKYFPDESQLMTCAADGTISYWEVYDGSSIRNIESTPPSVLNSVDITADGKHFVVGGAGRKLKLFRYDEGDVQYVGSGHSTDITKIIITPDQRRIVSTSKDGALFVWKMPVEVGARLEALP